VNTRDRYADLLRTLALGSVVLGHWLMAAVSVDAQGRISVSNALSQLPALHVVTWLFQLVPLFFFVGGVANAAAWQRATEGGGGWGRYVARRLSGLLRPAAVLMMAAPLAAAALLMVGLPSVLVVRVLVFILLPLWFLAVYVPVTAAAPVLLVLHHRYGARVPLLLAAAVALLDLVRQITGRIEFAWPNMLLLYALAQQLGFGYRDGLLRRPPRRWLALWAGGALGGLIVSTASPIWPTSMVGLPGEPSNMAPPGVPLLCLLLLQVPVVLLLRPYLEPVLQRPGAASALAVASERSMTIFLWHLPLLVAFAGVLLLLGVPLPTVGSTSWWLTRPLWLAGLMLLGLLCLALPGERSRVLQHR
jgi:peptidoglycan/LPS O-acetylase OafA/YrhL